MDNKAVTRNLEKRAENLKLSGKALQSFLQSPQGEMVPEYIATVLKTDPLMRKTPEETAYALGMFEVIRLLQEIQKGMSNE